MVASFNIESIESEGLLLGIVIPLTYNYTSVVLGLQLINC
jgi:hypothetical protein